MFYDHHGVACIDETLEYSQQTGGIGQVQAGSRLVEQIQRATGDAATQFLRQLDALGFAARKRGGGLPISGCAAGRRE